MKIHSISKIGLFITGVFAAVQLYSGFNSNEDPNVFILIGSMLVFIAIYVAQENIDFWWHQKYPPTLDPKVIGLLNQKSTFYKSLDSNSKQKFENRLSIYLESRLFKSKGKQERPLPHDIACIFSMHVIEMTFNFDDYLLGDYNRFFFYNHPFPSPRYMKHHVVEINHEDGLSLLSMPHYLKGVENNHAFYSIAYHIYMEIILYRRKDLDWSVESELNWNLFAEITGYSEEKLKTYLGLPTLDILVIFGTIFFTHPIKMKQIAPAVYQSFLTNFSLK